MAIDKWKCQECDAICDDSLQATNPFDASDVIHGCLACKQVNTLLKACDADGCREFSSCGTPTPDGYKNFCGLHYREFKDTQ